MNKNLFFICLLLCFDNEKNEYKNGVQINERLKTRFFSVIRSSIVSYQIGNE